MKGKNRKKGKKKEINYSLLFNKRIMAPSTAIACVAIKLDGAIPVTDPVIC